MTSSLLPLVLAAAASASALFGCEEMERGPSDPQPPKTAAAWTGVQAPPQSALKEPSTD